MNSTDDTIEFPCGECDEVVSGIHEMIEHIIEEHPNYSMHEVDVAATKWMEAAYDKEDQARADYCTQRKEEPSE